MSNLETEPDELFAVRSADNNHILEPREVPLGGPRALSVRRTLPQRGRSLIGPWCFLDHYGPNPVEQGTGMRVPPHPHTGLQTVSWLFLGEVEHRDSSGAHAMVRPGELNLMTAGRGIQHSEVSTATTTTLHGAQLWVALPDAARGIAPFFEHYAPAPVQLGEATLHVFLGSLAGSTSPASTFSPIIGAQIDLPPDAIVELAIDPGFEHGVLLDTGGLEIDGVELPLSHLSFHEVGASSIRLVAGAEGARALIIGGAPFGESIVMWWNFVGRSHDEIVGFRGQWQGDVIAGGDATGVFGAISDFDGSALPAPAMPAIRLKPRE